MSFSLNTYFSEDFIIKIDEVNYYASRVFSEILNLDTISYLNLVFKDVNTQSILRNINSQTGLFLIQSEYLEISLSAIYSANEFWQEMNFIEPNYEISIIDIEEEINRKEIILAFCIIVGIASKFGNNYIYSSNLFPKLIVDSEHGDIIYTEKIISDLKKNKKLSLDMDLYRNFNTLALE